MTPLRALLVLQKETKRFHSLALNEVHMLCPLWSAELHDTHIAIFIDKHYTLMNASYTFSMVRWSPSATANFLCSPACRRKKFKTEPPVMLMEHILLDIQHAPFIFTHGRLLLIRWHDEDILNLHHRRNRDNLFGAADVPWFQEHLGKHGAERKLCHPYTHGIHQAAVIVQTCQQKHSLLRV